MSRMRNISAVTLEQPPSHNGINHTGQRAPLSRFSLRVIGVHLTVFCLVWFAISLLVSGCGGSKSLATMSASELMTKGKWAYDNKKYLKAIELFQTIVYNYPGESIVDTAQYFLALSYFGNEEYELAGVEFNRLIVNYPASPYFEHAIFMKAVSAFESTPRNYGLDQTDLQDAIKQFEDFVIDFPESQLMADARQYLLAARTRMARKFYEAGIVYVRKRAFEAAKVYFQKVIDEYTDTEYAAQASFQYAEMEFKLGRFDEARQKFEDFKKVFPDHELVDKARKKEVEAAFKSGEAAFKNGDYALAEQRLQTFKINYPDNGRSKKVEEYLEKIHQITKDEAQLNEAGS
jgi:outer membrane protein assembly factor BamD